MRGSSVPGGSSTPGASVDSWMKLREFNGIASTACPGMLVCILLASDCSSGASLETVTVSRTPPTGSVKSRLTVCPRMTVTALRSSGLNPCAVT